MARWVKARAACNGQGCFDALLERVRHDVEQMNEVLVTQNRPYRFRVEMQGDGHDMANVYLVPNVIGGVPDDQPVVSIVARDNFVTVSPRNVPGLDALTIRCEWVPQAAACRYEVVEKHQQVGIDELGQMILEPLFFNSRPVRR